MAPKDAHQPCRCGVPTCNVDKKIKQTSDLLGTTMTGAALILNTLKNLSECASPGLKAASSTLLMVLDLFQNMMDAQSDFGVLIHDICNVVMVVARFNEERGGKMSQEMKRAIDELNHKLLIFKDYAEEMRARSKMKRLFFGVRDQDKVREYRSHFQTSLTLFQLEMGLDTNYNTFENKNDKNMGWEIFQKVFDQALLLAGKEIDIHTQFGPQASTTRGMAETQGRYQGTNQPPQPRAARQLTTQMQSQAIERRYSPDQEQYSPAHEYDHLARQYPSQKQYPQYGHTGPQTAYPTPNYYSGHGWPSHLPPPSPQYGPQNNVGSATNVNFGTVHGTFFQG